jgi:hypothetical protein
MAAQRPPSLLAVSIIALVLGGMGLLGSASGCFGIIGNLTGVTGSSMNTGAGVTPEMVAAQDAMMAALNAWAPVQIISVLLTLVLAILLILGGILVLASQPSGGRTLRTAFTLGLFIEPVRLLAGAMQAWWTWGLTAAFMDATTAAQATTPGMPSGFQDIVGTIMSASVVLGLVVGVFWMLIKMGIYVFGVSTLGSEPVQDYFLALIDPDGED